MKGKKTKYFKDIEINSKDRNYIVANLKSIRVLLSNEYTRLICIQNDAHLSAIFICYYVNVYCVVLV